GRSTRRRARIRSPLGRANATDGAPPDGGASATKRLPGRASSATVREMKAIIIGAGRGRRLQHLTREQPKCLVPIAGRPILSWILDALRAGGVDDIVYIGGYLMEEVRRAHPEFRFIENRRWEENNILESRFCAESEMDGPFITSY